MKRFLSVFLSITLIIAITFCALSLTSCSKKIDGKSLFNKLISIIFNENSEDTTGLTESTSTVTPDTKIDIDGVYTSKDDVALYIHTYGKLPSNFIKKSEAEALGWGGGSLEPYAPGKCIGGDYFGNYEEKLPVEKGISYHEADCYYTRGKRNAYRIIYSSDGRVWYTEDHYNTFTELFPTMP